MPVPGPVQLEIIEQQQALFEMTERQPFIDPVKGVGQHVKNSPGTEVGRQLKDIFPEGLYFPVDGLIDSVNQDMEFAAVFRKISGDFLADKGVRQVGDIQRPIQLIVVGDGDMGQPLLPGQLIKAQGLGKTFRAADFFQDPGGRVAGVLGVEVHIDFYGLGFHGSQLL